MRIAICDDNRFWLEKAKKMLLQYTKTNGIETEVCCFQSPFELETYQGAPPDVMFMDIELQERSDRKSADVVETPLSEAPADVIESPLGEAVDGEGITLAKYVNRRWNNCLIIYLTNYVYYALDVYGTSHVFYVLKTQFAKRLDEIFAIISHELEQKQKRLLFNAIGGGKLMLAPADILYFERCRRKTVVCTTWNTFEIWEKMDEVFEKVSPLDFVRCHNSYIVYLPAVVKVEKDCFVLKNDTQVLISRAYAARTKQAFSRWAATQIS